MTNKEIIVGEMVLNGISEEVDTFQGWKRKGYCVTKGSKNLFQTKIWKPCKVKNPKDGEKEKQLLMVKASFFGKSQVKKIQVA